MSNYFQTLFFVLPFLFFSSAASATTFTVTTLSDSGPGSLRAAMIAANADVSGPHKIVFDGTLKGSIILASNLPALTKATEIDGTTAMDAVAGSPTITINGANTYTTLIVTTTGNCTFNTLCIINSNDNGIYLNGAGNNTIKGCYIGVTTTGAASPNEDHGIRSVSSGSNIIGGVTAGERNIISANTLNGMRLEGPGQIIRGNYIGVGIDGATAMGNGDQGIELRDGSHNSVIGGSESGAGNIISANGDMGIKIYAANNVVIQGNFIGTNPSGDMLGNTNNGIHGNTGSTFTRLVIGSSTDQVISGEANVIAYNGRNGINFESGTQTGSPIRGNSIYCNGSGFSSFDYGSGSGNGNGSVPAPVIVNASQNKASGTCLPGYDVHVYRNDPAAAGCGCGAKIYVGKAITNGTSWTITHDLCLAAPATISAMQTDPATNNTGLLSVCSPISYVPNTAPVAVNDTLLVCVEKESFIDINLLYNDSDPDGDTIAIADVFSTSSGTVTRKGDSALHFVPNAGVKGRIVLKYALCDKSHLCFGETSFCDTAYVVFCIDSTEIILPDIFIPNLISPGDDAYNNVFVIQGLLPNSSLQIYNRWGDMVYSTENYSNDWKPHNEASGLYFFLFKDTFRKKEWKGWLQVISSSE